MDFLGGAYSRKGVYIVKIWTVKVQTSRGGGGGGMCHAPQGKIEKIWIDLDCI